jgi:ornithine cyclodeaminase/alanine dehydrogenase-like protein (mu-crystallin family)
MLVLNRVHIEKLLDLDRLIDALASAMADLSAGRASVPPRIAAFVPEHDGLLGAMPGYVPSLGVLMSKLVTLFPGNAGTPLPTHQAVIVTFDPRTGQPIALLDGTAITAIRTGAGSALSARLLAREDAATLAIVGTGVQARSHLRAMLRVRPIKEIRIAGRNPAHAAALVAEMAPGLDAEVRAMPSYSAALEGADIVCATTHAGEPVVRREWLTPGVHVTSVGYHPTGCEIDAATVADARVVVESRAAALAPLPAGSNDLLLPIRDGVITAEHVYAEIGELVAGTKPARLSTEDITLYKSVGVAVQDAAAAALVVAAAADRGIGEHLALE